MITDSIADYLTRIRNAVRNNQKIVEIPASNLKKGITKIMYEKGYILNYKFVDDNKQGIIKIALKYNPINKLPAINKLERVSKPSLRKYCNHDDLPRVMNGLGVAVVSTSKGLMTDKEARKMKAGGEIICFIS